MSDNATFQEAKTLIEENSDILRSMFHFIPEGTEISVSIEERLKCALKPIEFGVALEQREATNADVEIIIFPESIRRLKGKNPGTLAGLARELLTLWLSQQVQFRLLSGPQAFLSRGYLQMLAKAGPEIQKEVSKHVFSMTLHAATTIEKVKSLLKKEAPEKSNEPEETNVASENQAERG